MEDALFHHAAREDRKSAGMGLDAGGGVVLRSRGWEGVVDRVAGSDWVVIILERGSLGSFGSLSESREVSEDMVERRRPQG